MIQNLHVLFETGNIYFWNIYITKEQKNTIAIVEAKLLVLLNPGIFFQGALKYRQGLCLRNFFHFFANVA